MADTTINTWATTKVNAMANAKVATMAEEERCNLLYMRSICALYAVLYAVLCAL